jgi:hypothetical protein
LRILLKYFFIEVIARGFAGAMRGIAGVNDENAGAVACESESCLEVGEVQGLRAPGQAGAGEKGEE